ncbi:MAG: Pyruvate ferredoxin/flavodoxin oxidoreductase, delta subunit [Candidatus Moranbacteria bacterium GW2011_GWA2_39_41]|nr:MAG: Pyruvate ferredoxin/flavodoxin oxidoreductase, delta subunit [Candidatus Moranbacteria bacterium GW2011_GWA2_39_41]
MTQFSEKKFDFEEAAVIKHDIKKAPKTGDWRYMTPQVDKEKCIGCTTCVPFCPEASIDMKLYKEGQKTKADIDYDFCKGCGVCAQVCPVKVITMKKN